MTTTVHQQETVTSCTFSRRRGSVMLCEHLCGRVPRGMGIAGVMRFMAFAMLTFIHPPPLLEAAGLDEHDSLKSAVKDVLLSHPLSSLSLAHGSTFATHAEDSAVGESATPLASAVVDRRPAAGVGSGHYKAGDSRRESAADVLADELVAVLAEKFQAAAAAAAASAAGPTKGIHDSEQRGAGTMAGLDALWEELCLEPRYSESITTALSIHQGEHGHDLRPTDGEWYHHVHPQPRQQQQRSLRGREDYYSKTPSSNNINTAAAGTRETLSYGGVTLPEAHTGLGLEASATSAVGEGLVLEAAGCAEEGGGLEEAGVLAIESPWLNIALTAVCVVCAGLAAGLTMGLVSIEPLEMAIKQRSGTPEERLQASRILPLVTRHHFLLVTLLLFNSLANEALPIFLGNLVPDWLAIILSVSLVLFFGEILPSAVFTGKAQLAIASGMAWLVYVLMFVLCPIAWPLSWMLDRVLGIEGYKRYNRAEIGALMEVQQEISTEEMPLHPDEVAIVNGVLLTAEKCVSEAMVPMDKVFCLSRDEKLGGATMADIMASGYSRVLVYEGSDTRNIRGYLQVKKLIVLNPDDERDIKTLMLRIPVIVSPGKSLLELLNTFQTGHSHLALVSNSPGMTLEALKCGVRLEGAARPVGIITLEDIIEEIIQEEIMDESDRMAESIERRAKETLLRFTRKRQERKIIGKYDALGRTAPVTKMGSASPVVGGPHLGNSLRQGSTRSINSSRSTASVTAAFNEHGYDNQFDDDDAPAPPGLNERSKLLGTNKTARHSRPAATKRGSTIAHAIIASVAGETGGSAAAGGASQNSIVGASVLGSVAGVTATDVRGKLHLWRKANENGGASGAGDGQSS